MGAYMDLLQRRGCAVHALKLEITFFLEGASESGAWVWPILESFNPSQERFSSKMSMPLAPLMRPWADFG